MRMLCDAGEAGEAGAAPASGDAELRQVQHERQQLRESWQEAAKPLLSGALGNVSLFYIF